MTSNLTKIRFVAILAYLFLSVASASATTNKMQSGQAGIIFDRAFLQAIKSVKFYDRIIKIVGVPPVKVGEDSFKIPGKKYHWNGRKNTSFNIIVVSGKIVDANVVTPDGRIVTLGNNGELFEFGK